MDDVFVEKIVKKKKTAYDYISTLGLIILGVAAVLVLAVVPVAQDFIIIIAAATVWGLYLFVKYNNVEFEYSVVNEDIDIDKIMGQSKRKRLFSASCRDFASR